VEVLEGCARPLTAVEGAVVLPLVHYPWAPLSSYRARRRNLEKSDEPSFPGWFCGKSTAIISILVRRGLLTRVRARAIESKKHYYDVCERALRSQDRPRQGSKDQCTS
jgi:hypothetical protein